MGPWGAIIMSFFGSVFFALALAPFARWPSVFAATGTFVAFAVAAWISIRRQSAHATLPDPRAARIIRWATIGEGLAMPVVAIVLANIGHGDAVLCGVALVVGLHFVPMAYAIPFRPFYLLAAALVVAAAIGFALRQPLGSAVAGLGAAAALWIAAGAALRRSRPV